MPSGKYVYDPLSSTSALRIIRLPPLKSPDTEETTVKIQLFESSFEHVPVYEAVSYTWDGQSFTERILCNGKDLFVTLNVLAILHDFRNQDEDRLLWIDSICIDQSSSYDKSIQVPRMDRVYSQAQMVLVWLGKGSKETDAVFDCYAEMISGTPTNSKIWKNERGFWESTDEAGLDAQEDFGMGFIGSLFRRSWFTRAWTTQEIVLARHAVFICGSRSISYEDFINASRQFIHSVVHGLIDKHYDVEVRYTQLKSLIEFRHDDDKAPWEQAPFAAVLEEARQKHAFDPRDKIYSVYGILSALEIINLPPVDYNKDLADVYIEATRAAIETDNSLDVLLETCVPQLIPNLPSWVPDWSNTAPHGNEHGGWPEASGDSSPAYHFEGSALHLRGTTIDTVATVAPTFPDYGNINDTPDPLARRAKAISFIAMLRAWIALVRTHLPTHPTAADPDDVLAWTLAQTNDEIADTPSTRQHTGPGPAAIHLWLAILASSSPEHDIFPATNYALSPPTAATESAAFQRAFGRTFACSPHFSTWDPEVKVLFALKTAAKPVQSFQSIVVNSVRGKTLFVTRKGYLGLGAQGVRSGDSVVLVKGLRVPVLVRGVGEGEGCRLGGPVFVHGVMRGEMWGWEEGGLEDVVLV